jgi:antirestriction protein ArdC
MTTAISTEGSMARTPLTREEASAARAQRIDEAQAVLADAVEAIRDGQDWKRFLGFQSKLHSYSPNNCLLIVAAHAQLYEAGKVATALPSYVASYRKWQELGRQVGRGQAGIAIIAPMRGVRREAVDGDGQVRRLGAGEEPAAGEQETKTSFMRGFTVEKVFSAEQTTGDPLPEPPRPKLLEGEAPSGLGEAVLRLIKDRGFTVSTVASAEFLQGANGRTTFTDKTVQVRDDMDDAAMVKTLIHEAAHVVLHDPESNPEGAELPRGHQEVEAESVAFIVAHAHGMATDDYSFAYVAGWVGHDDHALVIARTAKRVATCARQIIVNSPAVHTDGGRPAPSRPIEAAAAGPGVEPLAIGV